ncbi:hypothetical protein [Pseudoxanthomonas sp. 3HH-4]|uniref:hypothetical protein n=1 Tax=Pseudoxanthomonas sp. 3HH-4 TaxID=1690214 RepID=UPI00114E5530|nr:hypothetical protein [Pseudoxanthomonas sp. 3HH-4]
MSGNTVSVVTAAKNGVIVIRLDRYDETGNPVPVSDQPKGRFQVIDVNGPPIVRFRGESPDEAWGFVDKSPGYSAASDEVISAEYLSETFRSSFPEDASAAKGMVCKVEIVDRSNTSSSKEFERSWVLVALNVGGPNKGGLSILLGEHSFDDLASLLGYKQRVDPATPTAPRPPRQRR